MAVARQPQGMAGAIDLAEESNRDSAAMIGDDVQGQLIRAQLTRAGVGIEGLFAQPGRDTLPGFTRLATRAAAAWHVFD